MTYLNVYTNAQPASAETKSEGPARRVLRPRYRVTEGEENYVALIDLPGVARDAVKTTVADGALEIEAARKPFAGDGWTPLNGATEPESVYRLRLALGDEIDPSAIAAKLQDGVLALTLPKAEEKKPRSIAVE